MTLKCHLTDNRLYYTTKEIDTTQEGDLTSLDSPPPTYISSEGKLSPQTTTTQSFEARQQLVNNHSTDSQQEENCGEELNSQNHDEIEVVAVEGISQQTSMNQGERGDVESSQAGSVLQKRGNLEAALAPSPKVLEQEPQLSEEEVIQIGDCIIDVITGFRGLVVSVGEKRVVYKSGFQLDGA